MLLDYMVPTMEHLILRIQRMEEHIQTHASEAYLQLKHTCLQMLEEVRSDLNTHLQLLDLYRDDPKWFKTISSQGLQCIQDATNRLQLIENNAMLTLTKSSEADNRIPFLIQHALDEMKYPEPYPSISVLSTSNYVAYPDLNLIQIPMFDQYHLLHLPDVFHEIGHLLVVYASGEDAYTIQKLSMDIQDITSKHYSRAGAEYRRTKKDMLVVQNEWWAEFWGKEWWEEFTCDVFATLVTGPAYGWSAIHLQAKNGKSPYECTSPTHPADQARMEMVLHTLRHQGFHQDATLIQKEWNELMLGLGHEKAPEYPFCFPNKLVHEVAECIVQALSHLRVGTAPFSEIKLVKLLNLAWKEFWKNPRGYNTWEQTTLLKLTKEVWEAQQN